MKKIKILTILNIVFSVFSWCIFIFNQLCNLRFLGLWAAWNLSGYAFVLLAGPLSVIFSIVNIILSFKEEFSSPKRSKYIAINISCAAITGILLFSCFAIPETITWA